MVFYSDMGNINVPWVVEGVISPEVSVGSMIDVIQSKGVQHSGTFWTWDNQVSLQVRAFKTVKAHEPSVVPVVNIFKSCNFHQSKQSCRPILSSKDLPHCSYITHPTRLTLVTRLGEH